MKKVVFDFDNTLTTFDTIFPYLYFINKDPWGLKTIKKGLCLLLRLFYRLKLIKNDCLKNWAVRLFIGHYKRTEIQNYSKEFFKEITYHENVYEKLVEFAQDDSVEVYLTTASFSEYVELLKSDFPNLLIQASLLKYSKNEVMGVEYNNYGSEKVKWFEGEKIDLLYTDSLSDLPLAKISKEIRFVTKNGNIKKCQNIKQLIEYCHK